MTHYKLNRIILGIAAVYAVVIVTAMTFGPTSSNGEGEEVEYTPGFMESASETPTPYTGVGGVPAEEPSVSGMIVDSETGEPLAGVSVIAENEDGEEIITTTGADGRFELKDVAEPITVIFSHEGYVTSEQQLDPISPDDEHTVALEQPVLAGRVSGSDGSPIRGATVAAGDVYTRSVESGVFRLENISEDAEITVKAAGYQTKTISFHEYDSGFLLDPATVQAIYVPGSVIGDADRFAEILDLIERTDLNAVALDLKDHLGRVHYDSGVDLAQEIEVVDPSYDVESVLAELEERDIYAIARIVTFEDPALAEARPELGIQDSWTGELWRTWQGRAWANPYDEEVRAYNVALMQEAAMLGFDEVQLASVQFPEDGLLNRADYGRSNTATRRHQAIADFLDEAYAAIGPTRSMLSADIFAMSLWDEPNDAIGQDLMRMAERVDYLNPLLFPSHFRAGSLGYDTPGDHPYTMVGRSIESGQALLPRHLESRLRPWLQGFSYGTAMPFGVDEIRRQIEAADTFRSTGWMLWNPDGHYPAEALEPVE